MVDMGNPKGEVRRRVPRVVAAHVRAHDNHLWVLQGFAMALGKTVGAVSARPQATGSRAWHFDVERGSIPSVFLNQLNGMGVVLQRHVVRD